MCLINANQKYVFQYYILIYYPFKRQSHQMAKHTQAIRWLNCLSVFDHFVGLALKGL